MVDINAHGRDESFYEAAGGSDTFATIARGFYRRVSVDPVLTAMYPEDDLGPAEVRLRMFLEQYWGGPTTYSDERGHPRLRMRHMPYAVTPDARDRWLACMTGAIDDTDLSPELRAEFIDYVTRAAHAMVNSFGDDGVAPPSTLG